MIDVLFQTIFTVGVIGTGLIALGIIALIARMIGYSFQYGRMERKRRK